MLQLDGCAPHSRYSSEECRRHFTLGPSSDKVRNRNKEKSVCVFSNRQKREVNEVSIAPQQGLHGWGCGAAQTLLCTAPQGDGSENMQSALSYLL